MKEVKSNVFGSQEQQMVSDMIAIGMSRRVANVLSYLVLVKNGTVKEITAATGLVQSEVCTGAIELSDYLIKRYNPSPSKGRSQITYEICKPIADIFMLYYSIKMDKFAKVSEAYNRLSEIDASVQAIQNQGA